MIAFVEKIFRYLRRRFIDAPRGLGHPVPAAAFDREYAAGHWDLLFAPEELPRNRLLLDLTLALTPHPRVLDIGCGSDRLAQLLAPHAPARYFGLDLSTEGLERARTLALPECEFLVGDFETWRPAEAERFDAIIFNESIGYARDPAVTLAAFATYLAPCGQLLVSYFRSGNHDALRRRITRHFVVSRAEIIASSGGQVWDIRALRPSAPSAVSPSPA